MRSCQISIGRSVLITIVRKEEETASVESDHFQSPVPRKGASRTTLVPEGSFRDAALETEEAMPTAQAEAVDSRL